jgi:hypothetical protein
VREWFLATRVERALIAFDEYLRAQGVEGHPLTEKLRETLEKQKLGKIEPNSLLAIILKQLKTQNGKLFDPENFRVTQALRRREKIIYFGAAFVFIGFIGQILGSIPGDIPRIGIFPN